jgi:hypothetical protein
MLYHFTTSYPFPQHLAAPLCPTGLQTTASAKVGLNVRLVVHGSTELEVPTAHRRSLTTCPPRLATEGVACGAVSELLFICHQIVTNLCYD